MVEPQERVICLRDGLVETKVLVAGQGEPVVFLHGAGGLHWDAFLGDLATRFTVYAPYHPGLKGSKGLEHLHHLWDLVLYYYDLFDALDLTAPAVIGHSFGGMVAAELAATDPKRLRRLVLLNAIGLWRDDQPVGDWMAMTPRQLTQVTWVDPESPGARARLVPPEDPVARVEFTLARTESLAATGKFIWPIPDKGLSGRLHRVRCPALIVWGRHDGLVPVVYAEEFAQRIHGARVEILDGASHTPQVEQQERVVQVVMSFLAN